MLPKGMTIALAALLAAGGCQSTGSGDVGDEQAADIWGDDDRVEYFAAADSSPAIASTLQPMPYPESVIITEVRPEHETLGSWFEVHNLTELSFELQGCSVSVNGAPHSLETSLILEPQGYATIDGLSLPASTTTAVILNCIGMADMMVYFDSAIPTTGSLSLRADSFDAVANNDAGAWCTAEATPGAANAACR